MDVFVFVVLVDLGAGLEQRLHEEVQEGGHSDLQTQRRGNQTWFPTERATANPKSSLPLSSPPDYEQTESNDATSK